MSGLNHHVLPLDMSGLNHHVLPLDVFGLYASLCCLWSCPCSTPVCASLNVSGQPQLVLSINLSNMQKACATPLSVCLQQLALPLHVPFYSSLFCTWRCLSMIGAAQTLANRHVQVQAQQLM
jgi:hypothetical protein